ncbi:MAG: response regulator [Gemmataceae bacterium]|nr:response regulator [Gemmataceae bacterium]
MLVLSRKPNESVIFPSLGISVRVVRVQGNIVRIGISAPHDVEIMREELLAADTGHERQSPRSSWSHAARNQLHKISLRLHLLQRRLEVGENAEAGQTLTDLLHDLGNLDQDMGARDRSVAPAPSKCRVLVVEDDSNERELLAGLLAMNGCECISAEDGLAAFRQLDAGARPDFVLLDMRMPRCDGPQTLRRIRSSSKYQGLKVIAISGTAPEEVGIETGGRGVDAWFAKPLDPRTLWDTMQRFRNEVAQAN